MQATATGEARTNLPLALTSFVGRERERVEVERLLGSARLLTLTGPPGCGKTRLALETGLAVLEQFPDGVWLVDLTQTGHPEAVPRLAAQALGLVILGDTDVVKAAVEYLQPRRVLLILDNCEHVLEAAAHLSVAVLSNCPRAQILATSQVPLGVPGEQEWLVPSLPVPDAGEPLPDLERLHAFAAVRLFEERAGAALPGFCVNDENAQAVVEICRRLDGIPLAIELAAARVKLFSVQEILARLEDRFALLAAPRRRVSTRHQTLQSAIDWSFNLLAEAEQVLLARLSVFTGSFDLQAAEEVCGYEPLSTAEIAGSLAELVDRSLVVVDRQSGPQTRCRLLDSIRQYGMEKLSCEAQNRLKDQHLEYYARLAEYSLRNPRLMTQPAWLDQIEADWANIRAAMLWILSHADDHRIILGLQIAAGLDWFFYRRNHVQEPVAWLETMLARAKKFDQPDWTAARAGGFYVLGMLHHSQYGPSPITIEQFEISRSLWKKIGLLDKNGYAKSSRWIVFLAHRDFDQAYTLLQEIREIFEAEQDDFGLGQILLLEAILAERTYHYGSSELKYRELLIYAREREDPFLEGMSYVGLSDILRLTGRKAEALQLIEEAVAIYKRTGAQRYVAMAMTFLAECHLALGNLERAEEIADQVSVIHDRMDINLNSIDILHIRSEIWLLRGAFDTAESYFRRSTRAYYQQNFWSGFLYNSLGLAAAVAEIDPAQAARIWGFANKHAGSMEETMTNEKAQAIALERLDLARRLLGDAAFERAMVEGAGCTLDEVIPPEGEPVPSPVPLPAITPRKLEKARYAGLTAREREIAARIARGLSNPAIAEELTISERTVTTHVTNILAKLGFSSRTQIAAWAAEKGLVQG